MDDFDRFRLAMTQIVCKRITWNQLYWEAGRRMKRVLTEKEAECQKTREEESRLALAGGWLFRFRGALLKRAWRGVQTSAR